MSQDDIQAEQAHAPSAMGATGLPLVGLTLGTDGAWSARFWVRSGRRTYVRRWCQSVRVIGDQLTVTFADALFPKPQIRNQQIRTVSAWGPRVQTIMARLKIGIVGAGSVGSIIAEALARTGIADITLLDFDSVEEVNLDRLLHAGEREARHRLAKVKSLAAGIRKGATTKPFRVNVLEHSIVEEEGFRAALDCDLLFSCVDRPWPRSVLNFIAYAHLIPVIDGGIQLSVKQSGEMRAADWRAHVVGPGRRCLECLGQYNSSLVSAEREGYFDDPVYVAGLPDDHSIKRKQNVFVFSLATASLELLQMLMMIIAPVSVANPGQQMYHFVPGFLESSFQQCNHSCPYASLTAKGDSTGLTMTGRHLRAEELRRSRQASSGAWQRLFQYVRRPLWSACLNSF